ncbi:MAG: RNA polymerase sigma factor [Methylococcaceae bacterium]|nr:RNA polymerase sigma factor [Methylococcaceae bacterium]
MPFIPQDSLQELFVNHRGELEALLFSRLRCRDTASDISQEAFVRLCRSDDLGKVGNLKAYLFRTALNLVNDHFRSQSVREAVTVQLPDTADRRSAETVFLAEKQLDELVKALAQLSPLCQRIFYLSRFEGLKQREIAEKLNISLRTVEDNLRRALLHCAKCLEN